MCIQYCTVSLRLEDAKLAHLQRAASHFGFSTSHESEAIGKLLDSLEQTFDHVAIVFSRTLSLLTPVCRVRTPRRDNSNAVGFCDNRGVTEKMESNFDDFLVHVRVLQ